VTAGQGALRLIRVALFALTAVGLAMGAHLAGGEAASAKVALLAVPAVMVVVNLLATRRRTLTSLLPAMAATQATLHLAFMATSGADTCRVRGGADSMVGMSGAGGRLVVHCTPAMDPTTMTSGLRPSLIMLAAHAVATVVLVVLLAHGETAVWLLASWLGFRRLRLGLMPRVAVSGRPLPVPEMLAVHPPAEVHRRTIRRRGPPVLNHAPT
jgi:hypothetical protein